MFGVLNLTFPTLSCQSRVKKKKRMNEQKILMYSTIQLRYKKSANIKIFIEVLYLIKKRYSSIADVRRLKMFGL